MNTQDLAVCPLNKLQWIKLLHTKFIANTLMTIFLLAKNKMALKVQRSVLAFLYLDLV